MFSYISFFEKHASMSDKKICGYRPAPENYNNWLTALHAERLKRLGQRNSAKSLGSQQRPMIIVLHLFADDIEGLQHWLDIIYELAAPTAYGECIDFVVDDLWGAYVFQLDGFSICRGDSSFDITSPPLIYGVSTAGEVHFFGNAAGPRIPSVESLGEFCGQLWQQKLVQEFGLESRLQVQPIHLADFNKYIYDEEQGDVLLCLYGSHTTHKFLQDLEILAAKLQHEQIKLYKMDVQIDKPPKKFITSTLPAIFFIKRFEKNNPLRFYDISNGPLAMLRFVAQHATDQLNFYFRDAQRKVHVELLQQMRNNFKSTIYYAWRL